MKPQESLIVLLQIGLPLFLLGRLVVAPARNLLGYTAQVLLTGLYLLVILLVAIWLVPAWWMPYVYLGIGFLGVAGHAARRRIPWRPRLPGAVAEWAAVVLSMLACIGLSLLGVRAVAGRTPPDRQTVEVAFPMGPGTYQVVNGGATQAVNAHLMTLEPRTDRQRAYRGQSYAVDLIKLGRLGLRAPGWRPRLPSKYEIFGEPVFAPCHGRVLRAIDGMPDMPVPEVDTSRLEGNHVFIDCAGVGVLLAHLKQDSIRVRAGEPVTLGQHLGRVGNSGRSTEPHLHIHAQRIGPDEAPFSGEPLAVTLDGQFAVRNQRIKAK